MYWSTVRLVITTHYIILLTQPQMLSPAVLHNKEEIRLAAAEVQQSILDQMPRVHGGLYYLLYLVSVLLYSYSGLLSKLYNVEG